MDAPPPQDLSSDCLAVMEKLMLAQVCCVCYDAVTLSAKDLSSDCLAVMEKLMLAQVCCVCVMTL